MMEDGWMFGLSSEAIARIYARRDREALVKRIDLLEAKIDKLMADYLGKKEDE